MRVASRRLRAVLEIYAPCFPRKELQATSCATSRRWPTRSASAATPTCSSRQLEEFARRRQGGRPRRASRSSPSACAPSRARATRCSPPRWPRIERDRPARPPRRAERRRLARARPATVVRPAAAGDRVKARTVKGLDPDGDAGRQPRAHRRRRAWTSCARSCPRALDPREVEGAARHAHRRQAPALHPRGRRRAVLRPVRRRPRSSAPRSCRTCSARSTTATSSSRASRAAGGAARRRRARGPRARRRRAATSTRRSPSGTPHAEAWRGLETLRVYLAGAPRAALRALPRAVARPRARGLPRAPGVRDQRAPARPPTPLSPADNGDRAVGRRSHPRRPAMAEQQTIRDRPAARAEPEPPSPPSRPRRPAALLQPRAVVARVQRRACSSSPSRHDVPLLERAEVRGDLHLEPRRVLHDPRRRPARPGRRRPQRPGRRRPHAVAGHRRAARAHRRARASARRAASSTSCARRWPSTASASSRCDEVGRRRARGARRALPAPDLPRPHAAGRRARAAVPVHLQPVAVARRPRARPADAGRRRSRA